MPERIRLQRTKGWRKPEGAVVVARPTKWGNPYTLAGAREAGYEGTDAELREFCTAMFRRWLRSPREEWSDLAGVERAEWIQLHAARLLRGVDLACWCPLDQACHADVLLEMADA